MRLMSEQAVTLLRAAWVAPMTGDVLPDAGVAFAGGRIVAVGSFSDVHRAWPGAVVQDIGRVVLLPGLVNAHTHLELSHCSAGATPTTFVDWVLSLPSRIGPTRDFAGAACAGAMQSLRFGVTCVGDISQHAHATRPVLRDGPLRVVSFGEALGIGGGRGKFDTLLERATDRSAESDFLRIGISPHAPYSVDANNYRRVVALSRKYGFPLCTHLAENTFEREFLTSQTGPFRDVLEALGSWEDGIPTVAGSAVGFARQIGLLDLPSLLAHVNDCDDADLNDLAAGRASVVWCPRTHAYFGHRPHRWRDMLARGVNVCVGTDSLASSPDLNPVEDLRLIHRAHPDVSPHMLWSMVTTRAARALGLHHELGTLSVAHHADLVAFPVSTDDPLTELLERPVLPVATWVGGKRVCGQEPNSGG